MFRQKSMSILKRDPRSAPRVIPKLALLFLAALPALLVSSAVAEARHRHYRHRAAPYSPPASAMAIDLNTGRILYSKNATEPRYPASLTKVMTLYLLFDALRDGRIRMNTQLLVSAHAAAQSPTKLGLSEGDKISVADAIGAIVTKSANDMAVAVAEGLAGSEEEFARRMTQKARTAGMLNTTFRNASGLPNSEQHTTAQDLIVLGKSILADHPERCKVFATKYFQYDGQVFRNHNTLLFSYQGMEGMKTGFTSASGFNLLASARRSDKRLLAVVLGGPSAGARNASMRHILDSAWPKAMTLAAAKKAGVLTAASHPKPAPEPAAKPAAAKGASKPAAEPAEKPAKQAANSEKPAAGRRVSAASAAPVLHGRLKRRPDRVSISVLLASIETSLIAKTRPAPAGAALPAADMTTDEPEEKAEKTAGGRPAYAAPAPQEIAGKETIAAMASPVPRNVSVHYKTVRPPEAAPLAAVSLDPAPEAGRDAGAGAAKVEPAGSQAEAREEPPLTLAAATAAESRSLDHPGPFHVQVGAFADEEQAKERLESVREALGAAALRAHPEFIMPVSLPAGGTMFRARLSKFSDEAQAKAACKKLRKNGIECRDVRAN